MSTGLLVALLVAAAVEILFPLLLGLWLASRRRTPWRLFGYGAGVYLVFEILTRGLGLSMLGPAVSGLLLQSAWYRYGWVLFVALTAGLFEEGGRYLGYRFFWKKDESKTWSQALMYGAGHGGLESMLVAGGASVLAIANLLYVFQVDPTTLLPADALAISQAREAFASAVWWLPLLAALERVLAMALHLALSVLVVQVFIRGRGYWWWLAVGYHALANLAVLLAADLAGTALSQQAIALLIEGVFLPFALLGLWIVVRLRPRAEEGAALAESTPGRA